MKKTKVLQKKKYEERVKCVQSVGNSCCISMTSGKSVSNSLKFNNITPKISATTIQITVRKYLPKQYLKMSIL